jgi:basic amino acid/polyamine antiporter, APA family
VCILVLGVDLRGAIGFSSFGVLLYYFVANAAAFTQTREQRRYPKALQLVGGTGCLILVATVPPQAIGVGIGVLLVGILYRVLHTRRTTRRSRSA